MSRLTNHYNGKYEDFFVAQITISWWFYLLCDIGGVIMVARGQGWCFSLLNEELKNPRILKITVCLQMSCYSLILQKFNHHQDLCVCGYDSTRSFPSKIKLMIWTMNHQEGLDARDLFLSKKSIKDTTPPKTNSLPSWVRHNIIRHGIKYSYSYKTKYLFVHPAQPCPFFWMEVGPCFGGKMIFNK